MKSAAEIARCEAEPGDAAPRTRKWLLWWLVSKGVTFADIVKAGPCYVIVHAASGDQPARICATGVRCIDSLTFDGWRHAVESTGAGFCIA